MSKKCESRASAGSETIDGLVNSTATIAADTPAS